MMLDLLSRLGAEAGDRAAQPFSRFNVWFSSGASVRRHHLEKGGIRRPLQAFSLAASAASLVMAAQSFAATSSFFTIQEPPTHSTLGSFR